MNDKSIINEYIANTLYNITELYKTNDDSSSFTNHIYESNIIYGFVLLMMGYNKVINNDTKDDISEKYKIAMFFTENDIGKYKDIDAYVDVIPIFILKYYDELSNENKIEFKNNILEVLYNVSISNDHRTIQLLKHYNLNRPFTSNEISEYSNDFAFSMLKKNIINHNLPIINSIMSNVLYSIMIVPNIYINNQMYEKSKVKKHNIEILKFLYMLSKMELYVLDKSIDLNVDTKEQALVLSTINECSDNKLNVSELITEIKLFCNKYDTSSDKLNSRLNEIANIITFSSSYIVKLLGIEAKESAISINMLLKYLYKEYENNKNIVEYLSLYMYSDLFSNSNVDGEIFTLELVKSKDFDNALNYINIITDANKFNIINTKYDKMEYNVIPIIFSNIDNMFSYKTSSNEFNLFNNIYLDNFLQGYIFKIITKLSIQLNALTDYNITQIINNTINNTLKTDNIKSFRLVFYTKLNRLSNIKGTNDIYVTIDFIDVDGNVIDLDDLLETNLKHFNDILIKRLNYMEDFIDSSLRCDDFNGIILPLNKIDQMVINVDNSYDSKIKLYINYIGSVVFKYMTELYSLLSTNALETTNLRLYGLSIVDRYYESHLKTFIDIANNKAIPSKTIRIPHVTKIEIMDANVGSYPIRLEGSNDYVYQVLGTSTMGAKIHIGITDNNDLSDILELFTSLPLNIKNTYLNQLSEAVSGNIKANENTDLQTLLKIADETSKTSKYNILNKVLSMYNSNIDQISLSIFNTVLNSVGFRTGVISEMKIQTDENNNIFDLVITVLESKYDVGNGIIAKENKNIDVDDAIGFLYLTRQDETSKLSSWYKDALTLLNTDVKYLDVTEEVLENILIELIVIGSIAEYFISDVIDFANVSNAITNEINFISTNSTDSNRRKILELTGSSLALSGNIINDVIRSLVTSGNGKLVGGLGGTFLGMGINALTSVINGIIQSHSEYVIEKENDTYLIVPFDEIFLRGLPIFIRKLYIRLNLNNDNYFLTNSERINAFKKILQDYNDVFSTLLSTGFELEQLALSKFGLSYKCVSSTYNNKSTDYVWSFSVNNNDIKESTSNTIESKVRSNIYKMIKNKKSESGKPISKILVVMPDVDYNQDSIFNYYKKYKSSILDNLYDDANKKNINMTLMKFNDEINKICKNTKGYDEIYGKNNFNDFKNITDYGFNIFVQYLENTNLFKKLESYVSNIPRRTTFSLYNIFISIKTFMLNKEMLAKFATPLAVMLGFDMFLYSDISSYINIARETISTDSKFIERISTNIDYKFIIRAAYYAGGSILGNKIKEIIGTNINYNILNVILSTRSCVDNMINFINNVGNAILTNIASDNFKKLTNMNIPISKIIVKYIDLIIPGIDISGIVYGNKVDRKISTVQTIVGIGLIALPVTVAILGITGVGAVFLGVGLFIVSILLNKLMIATQMAILKLHKITAALESSMAESSKLTFSLVMYNQLKYNIGLLYFNIFYRTVKFYSYKNRYIIDIINNILLDMTKSILKLNIDAIPTSAIPIFYSTKLIDTFVVFNSSSILISDITKYSKEMKELSKVLMLSNMNFKADTQDEILKTFRANVNDFIINAINNSTSLYQSMASYCNTFNIDPKTDTSGYKDIDINTIYSSTTYITQMSVNYDIISKYLMDIISIKNKTSKINGSLDDVDEYINNINDSEIDDDDKAALIDIINKFITFESQMATVQSYMGEDRSTNISNLELQNKISLENAIISIRDSLFSNAGVYGTSSYIKMANISSKLDYSKMDYFGYNPFCDVVYYKIYLIKESESDFLLYDSFFTYNSLVSIDIKKSKDTPIQTLKLVLNNPYNTLNNTNYIQLSSYGDVDVSSNEQMLSIYLQPGTKVKIMLSRDVLIPEYKTEFVGEITEIQQQNPMTIIAVNKGGSTLAAKYHTDDVYKYNVSDGIFTENNPLLNVIAKILYEIDKYGDLSNYTYMDIGGVYLDLSNIQFADTYITKKTLMERLSNSIKDIILSLSPTIGTLENKYDILSNKTNILENVKLTSDIKTNTLSFISTWFLSLFKAVKKNAKYFISSNSSPINDIKKVLRRTLNNIVTVRPYDERETIYIGPGNGYYKYTNKYDILSPSVSMSLAKLEKYKLAGAILKQVETLDDISKKNLFTIAPKKAAESHIFSGYVSALISSFIDVPFEKKHESIYNIADAIDTISTITLTQTITKNTSSIAVSDKKITSTNIYNKIEGGLSNFGISSNTKNIQGLVRLFFIGEFIFGVGEDMFIKYKANDKYVKSSLPILAFISYCLHYNYIANINDQSPIPMDTSMKDIVNFFFKVLKLSYDEVLMIFSCLLLDMHNKRFLLMGYKGANGKDREYKDSDLEAFDNMTNTLDIKNNLITKLIEHIDSFKSDNMSSANTVLPFIKSDTQFNQFIAYSKGVYGDDLTRTYSHLLICTIHGTLYDELYRGIADASVSHMPIRAHHVLSSSLNIVKNDIQLTKAPNAISLVYNKEFEYDKATLSTLSKQPKRMSVLDFDISKTIPKKLITRTSISEQDACGLFMPYSKKDEYHNKEVYLVASSYMKDIVADYYTGTITVLGDNYNPHDICFLYDDINDLYGLFEIKEVITSYSTETGYVSVLTPNVIVSQKEMDISDNLHFYISAAENAITFLTYAQAIYSIVSDMVRYVTDVGIRYDPSTKTIGKMAVLFKTLGIEANLFKTVARFVRTIIKHGIVVLLKPLPIYVNFAHSEIKNTINRYNMLIKDREALVPFFRSINALDKLPDLFIKYLDVGDGNPELKSVLNNISKIVTKNKTMVDALDEIEKNYRQNNKDGVNDKKLEMLDNIRMLYRDFSNNFSSLIRDHLVGSIKKDGNIDIQKIDKNTLTKLLISAFEKSLLETPLMELIYASNYKSIDKINDSIFTEINDNLKNFASNIKDLTRIANESTDKNINAFFGKENKNLINLIKSECTYMNMSFLDYFLTKIVKQDVINKLLITAVGGSNIVKSLGSIIQSVDEFYRNNVNLANNLSIVGLFYKNMPFISNLDGAIMDDSTSKINATLDMINDMIGGFINSVNIFIGTEVEEIQNSIPPSP